MMRLSCRNRNVVSSLVLSLRTPTPAFAAAWWWRWRLDKSRGNGFLLALVYLLHSSPSHTSLITKAKRYTPLKEWNIYVFWVNILYDEIIICILAADFFHHLHRFSPFFSSLHFCSLLHLMYFRFSFIFRLLLLLLLCYYNGIVPYLVQYRNLLSFAALNKCLVI